MVQTNFSGLLGVIERMTEIQRRFQPQAVEVLNTKPQRTATPFAPILQNQIQVPQPSGEETLMPLPPKQTSSVSGNIEKMLYGAAQKYGVDPKLAIAIAKAESGLDPNVVSAAGAVGVMQLMPATAAGLGIRDLRDPRENIDGGVRYLKQMLDTFQGDVRQAIAAYNAGPEAVKKFGGVPPYAETQQYVQRVLTYYRYS